MEMRPRGKAEVEAALIAAAAELFGKRSPSRVSIREVAALAGVNHGLVHRHFQNKESLLKAVLANYAAKISGLIAGAAGVPDALDAVSTAPVTHSFVSTLSLLLADGVAAGDVVARRGGVDALAKKLAGTGGLETEEARLASMSMMALLLGWNLFGDFLVNAARYPGTAEQARARMVALAGALAASAAGT